MDVYGLLITIALGRGETLEIEFRCSLIDCPTLRIGDYITAEGEQGGREERGGSSRSRSR